MAKEGCRNIQLRSRIVRGFIPPPTSTRCPSAPKARSKNHLSEIRQMKTFCHLANCRACAGVSLRLQIAFVIIVAQMLKLRDPTAIVSPVCDDLQAGRCSNSLLCRRQNYEAPKKAPVLLMAHVNSGFSREENCLPMARDTFLRFVC